MNEPWVWLPWASGGEKTDEQTNQHVVNTRKCVQVKWSTVGHGTR